MLKGNLYIKGKISQGKSCSMKLKFSQLFSNRKQEN